MEQNISNENSIPKPPLLSAAAMNFNDLLKDSAKGNAAAALPSPESTNPPKSPTGGQGTTNQTPSPNDANKIPLKEYLNWLVDNLEKGLDGKHARECAMAISLYFLLSRKIADLEMMPHLYLVMDHKFPMTFFIERFKKIFPNILVVRNGDSVKSTLYKFVTPPAPPLLFLDNLGLNLAFKNIFFHRPSEKSGSNLVWDSSLDLYSSRIILTKTLPSIKVRRHSFVLYLESLKGPFYKILCNEEFDKVNYESIFSYELNIASLNGKQKSDLSTIEPTFWLRQISDDLLEKEIITEDDHNAILQLFDRNSAALKRDYEYDEDLELLMWINNFLSAKETRVVSSSGGTISKAVSLESISTYIKDESEGIVKPSIRKLHFLMAEYDIAVKFFRQDVAPRAGTLQGMETKSRRQLTHVIIDLEKLRSILTKE